MSLADEILHSRYVSLTTYLYLCVRLEMIFDLGATTYSRFSVP